LGVNGDTELIKRLDEYRKQFHLDSLEDLEKAAKEQGISYEDFKAKIRNDIITQQVVRDEVGRRLQITPSEIQRFYDAHKQEFSQPESVRLSEILVSTGSAAPSATEKGATVADDPQRLATAKAKADDIEEKLKAGQSFETLARTYSDGTTAAQGGDLGNFKRGQLAKELEDKTYSLKPGEFTAPIRTKQGYIILKLAQHNAGGVPDFKDVEPQVEEMMYVQRMQPALRQYLATLREQAYYEVKPGYVDSGSNGKQTRLLFSAYTPPAPKKKKKVQRVRFREKTRTVRAPKGAENAPALPPAPVAAQTSTPEAPAASTEATESSSKAQAAATPAATSPSTAATTTPAPATATGKKDKNAQVAEAGTLKPGKKEKIRFGQAPRETLPKGKETKIEDAGAQPASEQPGAQANVASAQDEPDNPLAPSAKPEKKTRFSERAKQPKEKKQKGPKADPFAPPPPDAQEVATDKTQAAPLGLSGDTATKKKKQKQKAESGQKTRYSEKDKKKPEDQQQQPDSGTPQNQPAAQPSTTPAPQQ